MYNDQAAYQHTELAYRMSGLLIYVTTAAWGDIRLDELLFQAAHEHTYLLLEQLQYSAFAVADYKLILL